MTERTIRWARVSYQSDLRFPTDPVPLGVVVAMRLPPANHEWIDVLGRVPNPHHLPTELGDLGTLGKAQVLDWVHAVSRDILLVQSTTNGVLEYLGARWRWNLYISDAEEFSDSSILPPLELARGLYARHVGKPFDGMAPHRGLSISDAPPMKKSTWSARETTTEMLAPARE